MTRKEKLKILNSFIKGFRPINDVFADWPTKIYYMNDETDPPTFEDDEGETVSPKEIYKQMRTYPKVKIRPMDYSPKDIKNFIRAGLKRMEDAEKMEEPGEVNPKAERKTIIEYEEIDERPLKPWQIPRTTNEEPILAPMPPELLPLPPPPPNPPMKPEPPPKMYHIW